MLNDWTDRMTPRDAAAHWRAVAQEQAGHRLTLVEADLRQIIPAPQDLPTGFFEAMGHFLKLRDTLFPGIPTDPAWKILVTLAQTPPDSAKNSVTGIAHGAEVPLSTALRYLAVLEVEGIVERAPHPHDKRQVMIRLTDEGKRRLETIADRWTSRALLLVGLPVAALAYAAVAPWMG